MFFRYLASGCTLTEIHFTFRIGISTASKIIRTVCCKIWDVLKNKYIPAPSKENWKTIAKGFEKTANFPHCLGAIDGKHIRLIMPEKSGSMYYNYKNYFSIVLLAVADSNYRFTYIDIGAYGKECDSTIFKESSLWKLMEKNELHIPDPEPINELQDQDFPYVFLGDEAFALTTNLLRPFGGYHLTTTKKVFNYRLSRARRYVECAFGILSNKWRILHRPLNVATDFAVDIVKAACILHNIIREKDGLHYEEHEINELPIMGFEDAVHQANYVRGGRHANEIRNKYAEYFVSDAGSVPWQNSSI